MLRIRTKGVVFHAPLDVYFDETQNAIQPDLIVVLQNNIKIIEEKGHIHGVPDMLLEIQSTNNKQHDLVRKKSLYERFGVKEYWIIDPDNKLAIGFELKNGIFQLMAEDTGIIKSKLLQVSFTFTDTKNVRQLFNEADDKNIRTDDYGSLQNTSGRHSYRNDREPAIRTSISQLQSPGHHH